MSKFNEYLLKIKFDLIGGGLSAKQADKVIELVVKYQQINFRKEIDNG